MSSTDEGLKDLSMTVTFRVPEDIGDRAVEKIRRGLERYANTMMWVRGAEVGVEPPTPDTSINIYFTGDEDGPDLFGLVYDDEDSVLESAHENEVHGWRVPVLPLLEKAVRLDGDSDA